MAKEYFWGATLSKDKKIFKWDPESDYIDDEDDEDDDGIVHFLFLKQAVLGLEAKDGERNVVEVETVNFDGETVTQPLLSLRLGLNESTNLDIGLQPPVTFKLATGSGPVFLSGQHALDLQEDEDFEKDFKGMDTYEMGDEDVEDEEEGEEEEEDEETPKKVSTKAKDKKKAAVKAVKKGKGDEVDEEEDEEDDEDEEEEEEEEEEKQTTKGKKRPAPSAKGAAKKLAKVDKDGTSKRKITNGSIENGHANGLDDDDDDEDDEDYKVHDIDDDDEEEEDTSAEEEEEEDEDVEEDEEMALGDDDDEDDEDEDDDEEGMDDEDDEDEDEEEEEESSPEKQAKKSKGKVNGTVKPKGTPKGTPKTQASKAKGKKEQKTYSMDDMKQDLMKSPSKPKKEDKFKNFVKSKFHLSEAKKIQELWGWYKATQLK